MLHFIQNINIPWFGIVFFFLILLEYKTTPIREQLERKFIVKNFIFFFGFVIVKIISFKLFYFILGTQENKVVELSTYFGIIYWISAFLWLDFLHYGFHWLSHRAPLLWLFHSYHHASQWMNLSVGFRLHWISPFFNLLLLIPLLILGFNFFDLLLINQFILAWQFLLHTRLNITIPWLNKILICPRQHLIHHSVLPDSSGKNLGAVLSIWDRIFNTWEAPSTNAPLPKLPKAYLKSGISQFWKNPFAS